MISSFGRLIEEHYNGALTGARVEGQHVGAMGLNEYMSLESKREANGLTARQTDAMDPRHLRTAKFGSA